MSPQRGGPSMRLSAPPLLPALPCYVHSLGVFLRPALRVLPVVCVLGRQRMGTSRVRTQTQCRAAHNEHGYMLAFRPQNMKRSSESRPRRIRKKAAVCLRRQVKGRREDIRRYQSSVLERWDYPCM